MFDLRVVEVVISLLAGLGAVGAGVRVADYEVKRICFHCRRICKHFHQLWTPAPRRSVSRVLIRATGSKTRHQGGAGTGRTPFTLPVRLDKTVRSRPKSRPRTL